jgi:hypothetical protein
VKHGEAALQTLKSAECVAPACTIRSDGGDIVVLVMPKRDLDYIRSCLLDLVRREREADATPGKYL